jgi:hypothetical protein
MAICPARSAAPLLPLGVAGARRGLPSRLGAIGAVLTFVGFATFAALQQVPFKLTDESAHLGYAHHVAGWQLPDITSESLVPAEATQWRTELASAPDARYRAVWVANHPPLPYVAAAPLIWWSNLTGRPDGGLLLMRFLNVGFAAIGVGLTYLLGRELSGGAGRVGVLAAALVALAPHGHALFGAGLTDGMAFAAGTFVTWAGVVCLRRGVTAERLGMLALAAAIAAGTRAVTALVAVAVVGFVGLVEVLAAPRARDPADRARAALPVVATLLPATVIWGWFYVRNTLRYGDVGASRFLLDRFERTPRGSWLDILTSGHVWVDLHRALLWRSPPITDVPGPLAATLLMGTAVVGLAVVAATRRSTTRDATTARDVGRSALVLAGLVVAVVVATTAHHLAGGGGRYARYLLPSLGALASLLALGLYRLSPRVLPLVTSALLCIQAIRNLPLHVDPHRVQRPRDDGPLPLPLQELPGSPLARSAAAVLIAAGLVVLAVALTAGLERASPRPPPRVEEELPSMR